VPRPILNPRSSILAALLVATAPLFVFACSGARYSTEPGAPTLVVPGHFGEGKAAPSAPPAAPPAPTASSAAPAGSSAAPVETPTASNAPDPTALRMAEQVEYQLELSEGKIHVLSVKPVKLKDPIVTPRRVGRYAIELSIGHELIERVRFDFPGTAADDPQIGPKKPLFAPLTLSERAIAHVTLLVPQSPRVRRALLVDRGTGTVTELDWPLPSLPKTPLASSSPPAAASPSPPPAASSSRPPASPAPPPAASPSRPPASPAPQPPASPAPPPPIPNR
jgi:hypothetical protein